MIELLIIPIGDLDDEIIKDLAGRLESKFGVPQISSKMPVPQAAYNPCRNQYDSWHLLKILKNLPGNILLGITHVDLYAEGLNFVFGRAEVGGRCCLISTARLLHHDTKIFYNRIEKEAIHEIGHVLGLRHCSNRKCVMFFSNSIFDTDAKEAWFCERCFIAIDPRKFAIKSFH
ncbi:MAG: archaemetzincin family Zn-dependent metalloprotease [Methanomassiliicoccales archaeon]